MEKIDPTLDSARWRRLLEYMETSESRRRRDRETADAIWYDEQTKQTKARAELAAKVRAIPAEVTEALLATLAARDARWSWRLGVSHAGAALVGAGIALAAIEILRNIGS